MLVTYRAAAWILWLQIGTQDTSTHPRPLSGLTSAEQMAALGAVPGFVEQLLAPPASAVTFCT